MAQYISFFQEIIISTVKDDKGLFDNMTEKKEEKLCM